MRNAACMADYREVQHGFNFLHRFFSDEEKAKIFHDTFNLVAPEAAKEAITQFDDWWKQGAFQYNTFVASISEHDAEEDFHGRLSMWRAFGGNTARVGLVFNVPAESKGAEALNLIFSPVVYFKHNEAEWILEVIENVKKNINFLRTVERQEIINWIFHMLLIGVTRVKHEGFREEKEWRVVHCPRLYANALITTSSEIIGGVPQIVFRLPFDRSVDPILDDIDISKLFDRLIIGPSPYPAAMFEAFSVALSNAGISDAENKIFISNIPIRS